MYVSKKSFVSANNNKKKQSKKTKQPD